MKANYYRSGNHQVHEARLTNKTQEPFSSVQSKSLFIKHRLIIFVPNRTPHLSAAITSILRCDVYLRDMMTCQYTCTLRRIVLHS